MMAYTCPRNNWIEQRISKNGLTWRAEAPPPKLEYCTACIILLDSCQLLQPLAHKPMETTCKRHQYSQACGLSPNLTVQAEITTVFIFLPVAYPIPSESFVCRAWKWNGMGIYGAELLRQQEARQRKALMALVRKEQ